MYGGYGGMGGVGGYSSYGGGMGSYGMGGYGSSLGSGLGSTYGSSLAQNQLKGKVPPVDPNNPQQQKQNEQINHRKMFFQQWFKMMGGLRSILQLGFAGIALANFWSKGTQIFKKLLQFLKQTGKSLASFIESKIPTKIFSNLSQPQKRGKVLKSIIIGLVRIFALILLCIGIKLKQQIVMQAKKKSEQMKIQLQKLKNSQRQMQEDDQFENRVPEIMGTEANL